MLKRILATTAVLACCALPLAAQAHEKMAGDEMTITAQVVDLTATRPTARPARATRRAPRRAPKRVCRSACCRATAPCICR